MQESTPEPQAALDPDTVVRTEESGAPPVNIRLSVPLLRWRFYFAITSGRERRNSTRLAAERQRNPLHTPGNMLFVVAGAMVVYLVALGALMLNAASKPF